VKRDIKRGNYHGGSLEKDDYDAGHAGMILEDFVQDENSVVAKLKRHHVLVLRLYTSNTYRLFNGPLRRLATGSKTTAAIPHPLRFTVYVLTEALKMLRVVAAKQNPEEFNTVQYLHRGMADMTLDVNGRFLKEGGTELALMSTTDRRDVALDYARRRNFSKVCFLLNLLCELTIALTFENFHQSMPTSLQIQDSGAESRLQNTVPVPLSERDRWIF
jgi:hypothetical protein